MDLADMRDLVERDLHDESNLSWSTNEIDRAIQQALQQFSYAIPVEDTSTESSLSSRDIDISGLSTRVIFHAVEYPSGNYPQTFVRFSVFGDTLTILVDTAPDGTYNAKIYYGKMQSLITADAWQADTAYSLNAYVLPTTKNGYRYKCTTAGTSDSSEPTWPTTIGATVNDNTAVWTCEAVTSTIPAMHEWLIALGAVGYALSQWGAEAINNVNVGGSAAARAYKRLGDAKLSYFRRQLKVLSSQNRVRVRQLYTPYYPISSKSIVQDF
jgi:hypothetical protein